MAVFESKERPIIIGGKEFVLAEWLSTYYNLSGEYLTCEAAIGFIRPDHEDKRIDYFVFIRYIVPIGPALPYSVFSGSPSNMDWNAPGFFVIWGEGMGRRRVNDWDDATAIFEDFRKDISASYEYRVEFLKSIGVEGFE